MISILVLYCPLAFAAAFSFCLPICPPRLIPRLARVFTMARGCRALILRPRCVAILPRIGSTFFLSHPSETTLALEGASIHLGQRPQGQSPKTLPKQNLSHNHDHGSTHDFHRLPTVRIESKDSHEPEACPERRPRCQEPGPKAVSHDLFRDIAVPERLRTREHTGDESCP